MVKSFFFDSWDFERYLSLGSGIHAKKTVELFLILRSFQTFDNISFFANIGVCISNMTILSYWSNKINYFLRGLYLTNYKKIKQSLRKVESGISVLCNLWSKVSFSRRLLGTNRLCLHSPRWNPPWLGEGAFKIRGFNKVRQWEKLN